MDDDDYDFSSAEEKYGFENEAGGGEDPYGEDPYGEDPYGEDPYGEQIYGEQIYGEDIDSEEEYIEKQEFSNEVDSYNRVAYNPTGKDMQITISEGGGLASLAQIMGREYKDPSDRFRGVVDAIARSLEIEEGIIGSLVSKIGKLKNIEYLNPVGYIFGYLATDGGKQMDNAAIQAIFKEIPQPRIQNINAGLEPPDVIRYARYWINLRRRLND